MLDIPFDFENRRALALDGGNDDRLTLTTVQDLAAVVAKAIDYEGEWPTVGGIRGAEVSVGQLLSLGEKVRGLCASLNRFWTFVLTRELGAPFEIEKLTADELGSGSWTTSWVPRLDHPSTPAEQVDMFSRIIVAGFLLAASANAYHCSNEWSQLLPEYKFTQPEEFLAEAWRGKP